MCLLVDFVSPLSILLHVAFYCGFVSFLPDVKEKSLSDIKLTIKRTGSPVLRVDLEDFCLCVFKL